MVQSVLTHRRPHIVLQAPKHKKAPFGLLLVIAARSPSQLVSSPNSEPIYIKRVYKFWKSVFSMHPTTGVTPADMTC